MNTISLQGQSPWIYWGIIGVANGPAEPARSPTKYPAGPENVFAGPVKTDRSP